MSLLGVAAGVLLEQYDITQDLTEVSLTAERTPLDATTLGSTAHRFRLGLADGGLQLNALYNDDVSGVTTILKSILSSSTPKIATSHPKGIAVGNPAELCYGDEGRFDDSVRYADIVSVSAYLQASEDGIDFGVWLTALAAVTFTGNGTSVDNGAATTNGGVGVVHTTAIAGAAPSVVWKIQHSTDNSTWVDLITFTASTAVGAERIEVAAGTTVNRYLRAIRTFGGTTSSITSALAFARR